MEVSLSTLPFAAQGPGSLTPIERGAMAAVQYRIPLALYSHPA
jgi:hypothetical protein